MMQKSEEKERKICIVLDTNVWIYQSWLLRSILGAAFLYVVHQMNAKIGLPEVVELEIIKHSIKSGKEATSKIEENYSIIEKLIGKRDDYHLPTQEEFEQAAKDRLQQLDGQIMRIPFTFVHAKGALIRIMEETPPNKAENQQFKDSAIWEAILEVSKEYDVHLITKDKAFFENRDPQKGLAKNLANEAKAITGNLMVYYGLDKFLEDVKQTIPPLDKDRVANVIGESLRDFIEKETEGAQLDKMINSSITAFLTELPNELAIKFCLNYIVALFDENGVSYEGLLSIEGECYLNLELFTISRYEIDSISISTPEGCPVTGKRTIYGRCIVNLGNGIRSYKLREPLQEN